MPDDHRINAWRTGRLGEICEINPDKRGADWPHEEIEYIDISSVGTGTITSTPARMPAANAPSRAQRLVRAGDSILATVRPNLRSFAYLADPQPNTVVSTGFAVLRARRATDQRFIYYVVTDQSFTDYLAARAHGSAYPAVSVAVIQDAETWLPPEGARQAIGEVLGSLDDKIEQNRRTARALERLARAIFKAWFVDFEPVKAKAAGAASFTSMPQEVFDALPTAFEDSEIGPLPEGWEVKRATDVATVAIGKTPPRKEPQWFTTDASQVPWVSIRDLGTCGAFISETSEYLTYDAVQRFNIRRIPDASVLLSFKLTLGRVAIADGEITSNEAIAHFVPLSPESVGTEYLYCYLLGFDHNKLGSTSSIATATNSQAVKGMPVLVPASSSAEAFTQLAAPLFDCVRALSRESRQLAAMRDYLLPKLLSGSVRVEVADG